MQQKGNLEDSKCATRVSREKLCRLLCFLLATFCVCVFLQSFVMVFKIYQGKLFSGGEERFLQDHAVQGRGQSARGIAGQDVSTAVFCFQLCLPPEREVLSPFCPNAANRVL